MWRCLSINKEFRVNQEIKASKALVIDSDGNKQLGVLPISKALEEAEKRQMDLVQVSPGNEENDRPPTCKIMNYGKYCYEQSKKGREARKKQKVVDIKEIRFSVNIDTGDLKTKIKRAIEFLENSKKVKVVIRFYGRESSNPSKGYKVMERFARECSSVSNIEVPAKMDGRNMYMFLVPKSAQTKNQKSALKDKTSQNMNKQDSTSSIDNETGKDINNLNSANQKV